MSDALLPQPGGFEGTFLTTLRRLLRHERAAEHALVGLTAGAPRLVDVEGHLLPIGGHRAARGRVEQRAADGSRSDH